MSRTVFKYPHIHSLIVLTCQRSRQRTPPRKPNNGFLAREAGNQGFKRAQTIRAPFVSEFPSRRKENKHICFWLWAPGARGLNATGWVISISLLWPSAVDEQVLCCSAKRTTQGSAAVWRGSPAAGSSPTFTTVPASWCGMRTTSVLMKPHILQCNILWREQQMN